MKTMSVAEVAAATGAVMSTAGAGKTAGAGSAAGADQWVTSAEFDTRKVQPGALFVALVGERVDGHDLIEIAAAAGAVAALVSDPAAASTSSIPVLTVTGGNDGVLAALAALATASVRGLPDLTVIGVTGSAGKTSTKDLIAALASAAGKTVYPPESFNNELGHPYTVLRADETTKFLVLELSARGPGHIAMLARVAPLRIGAVLNVGTAHVGEFGSVEGTAIAKGELVESLSEDGVAILNVDDFRVAAMADRTVARVLTFGTSEDAEVRAVDVQLDEMARPQFMLLTPQGSAEVSLAVSGVHQVSNALAAAAVGLEIGLSTTVIAEVLGRTGPASKWRMEITHRADGVTIVNDAYNANPESMKAALKALATIGEGKRTWAVLGEMADLGNLSQPAHEEIGRLVVRLGIDRLIAVGPAIRSLFLGAHLEGSWGGEAEHVQTLEDAVAILGEQLRPGDVVLVKASRSVGLERVALALLDPALAGSAGPAGPASAANPDGASA